MTMIKQGIVLSLVLATGCAVKLNGKSYGTGGGGGGGGGAGGSVGGGGTPGGRDNAGQAPDVEYDPDQGIEPYPTAPADPWAAVDGDGPRRISEDEAHDLKVRNRDHECTAAHDHCLLKLTWFIESEGNRKRSPTRRTAVPGVFGPEEPGQPWNVQAQRPDTNGGFTAYRTVPATRALLAKGAVAVALDFPVASPGSGGATYGFMWSIGVVDRVDWDGGKLYLVAREEPFLISASRVAVLSWQPGGKVTLMNQRTRAQIAVAAADVILPRVDRGTVADPWAAVAKDKTPKVSDDTSPLLTETDHECDAAHDHCLRSWVWFVEAGGKAVPGRWDGKAFLNIRRDPYKIDRAGMAYRTVPATAKNLKVGATVVFYDHSSSISYENDAMGDPWRLTKVKQLQLDAGLVVLEDGDSVGIEMMRVAVVQWFPGEVAEALP